jgi:hypothetical protein
LSGLAGEEAWREMFLLAGKYKSTTSTLDCAAVKLREFQKQKDRRLTSLDKKRFHTLSNLLFCNELFSHPLSKKMTSPK